MTTRLAQPLFVTYPVMSQMVTIPSSSSQSICCDQFPAQMTPVNSTPTQPQSQSQPPNVNFIPHQDSQIDPGTIPSSSAEPQVDSSVPSVPNQMVNSQPIFIASSEGRPVISQATLIPSPTANLMSPQEFFSIPIAFPTASCTPECCPPNMTLAYVPTHFVQMDQSHQYSGHLIPVEANNSQNNYSYLTQSVYPPSVCCENVVNPPYFIEIGPVGWPMIARTGKKMGIRSSLSTVKHTRTLSERKNLCGFCKSNRESKEMYKSHRLKKETGEVNCPVLRKYVCPLCQQTGDLAHTISYCPLNPTIESAENPDENNNN